MKHDHNDVELWWKTLPDGVKALAASIKQITAAEPERFCQCDELLDSNENRRPAPKWHNCEYVRRRNLLIGDAFALAAQRVKLNGRESPGEHSAKWTRAFSMAMDELARPLLSDPKRPDKASSPPGLSIDKEPSNEIQHNRKRATSE
jgi:hypothetical protein